MYQTKRKTQPISFIQRIGPYGNDNRTLMTAFLTRLSDLGVLNETTEILGLVPHPSDGNRLHPCSYTCATPQNSAVLKQASSLEHGFLTAASYLVLELEHTAKAIEEAYAHLETTLSLNALHSDITHPLLERYTLQSIRDHQCELWIPIQEEDLVG